MEQNNTTSRPRHRTDTLRTVVVLLALVVAATLVQLGCHNGSSLGVFPDEPGADGGGPSGSTGPTGTGGTGEDPGDSGSTDPDSPQCTEDQIVMCIHDPGAASSHAACVDQGDVLAQTYNHGDYEGECVENELRICHQDPSLAVPRAIWIPAAQWQLHQTHTNGKPGPGLRYDRMLSPSEYCVFGLDY